MLTQSTHITASLLALSLLLGCGGNSNNQNIETGQFRIVNAVSDSPPLRFVLERLDLGSAIFGQASSLGSVRAARYDTDVQFIQQDGTATLLLNDFRVRVREDQQVSFIVAGSMAAPTTLIINEPIPDIADGMAEVHFAHVGSTGALDLYLTAPGAEISSAAPLASITSGAVSPLASVNAGTYQLRATAPGSTAVIYDAGSFDLTNRARRLLLFVDYQGPGTTPVRAINIGETRTISFAAEQLTSSVRIANLVADVAGFDAFLDSGTDTTQWLSLPANSLTDATELVPGSYDIAVTMETDPGTEYFATTAQLIGGEARTLVVVGSFVNNTITARLALNPVRRISIAAQINFVHGAADAGRVNLYLLLAGETISSSSPLVSDVGLLSNVTSTVTAGSYTVVATAIGDATELFDPVPVTLTNTGIYSIYLADADGGGGPPQLILGDDFE